MMKVETTRGFGLLLQALRQAGSARAPELVELAESVLEARRSAESVSEKQFEIKVRRIVEDWVKANPDVVAHVRLSQEASS